MSKQAIALIAGIVWPLAAWGQTLDAASRLDEISNPAAWVRFGEESGLARGQILDIVESDKRIWAGHSNGLYSYDGYRWSRLESLPEARTRISKGLTHRLIAAVQGRMFVGDENALEEVFPGMQVVSAFEFRPGSYLLRGPATSYWTWRPGQPPVQSGQIGHLSGRADFHMGRASVWWNDQNRLVRSADGDKTYFLSSHAPRIRDAASHNPANLVIDVLSEAADGSGIMHATSPPDAAGLWEWSSLNGRMKRRDAEGVSPAISGDIDPVTGHALIVYTSGDVRIRVENRWRRLSWVPQSLRSASNLQFASNGDLWVWGSEGLHLFHESNRWRRRVMPFPNPRNSVHAMLAAADGSMWVASQGGLEHYSSAGSSVRFFDKVDGRKLNILTGLNQDRNGDIWISSGATLRGAYRWNGHDWKHFGAAEGFTDQRIHQIQRDEDGTLWFVSTGAVTGDTLENAGALEWDGKRFRRWNQESGLAFNGTYGAHRDSAGNTWFFTTRVLSRRNSKGEWRHWNLRPDGGVWSISAGAVTSDGKVYWLDRQAGLFQLDGRENPRNIETPGLSGLREVREAKDGALWITSDMGVGLLRNGVFARLPTEEGLPSSRAWPIEFWRGHACVGLIGMGWTCLEHPETPNQHRVQIGKSEEVDRNVQISWTVASFWGEIPPERIETRYRLDGGPWSAWGTQRRVSSSKLWPGLHKIDVQAKGLFGDATPSETANFQFRGPYYLRPEYLVPVTILLASVLTLAVILIRRQREYSKQLQSRDARFRVLVEKSSEGVFLLDNQARMIYCSPAVERLLGRPEQVLLGGQNWDWFLPDDLPEVQRNIRNMISSPGVTRQFRRRILHGSLGIRWFELTVTNHLSEPEVGAMVVLFRDVTDQEQQAAHLARAKEMAENASKAKTDFLATMSHEIRTPMNGMLGMAELLAGTRLDGEQSDYVHTLQASGSTLVTLVSDILDLSRIESGKLLLEKVEFEPRILLEEAAALWKPSAILKGLIFDLDITACPSGGLLGDPGRLRQVISNVAGNAVKFTASGRICLKGAVADGFLRVEVEDSGIGISADQIERVFDKFVQADSSTTRKFGGSGLGLTISRQLVELMGGCIEAASIPGGGSRFWFQVPAEIMEASPQLTRENPPVEPVSLSGVRVLLAEDNAINQKVIRGLLAKAGCVVEVASNGREAVEMWQGGNYHLIFMDCQMPEVDGFEATVQIRALETGYTPIIALTANAMLEDRARCAEAGMDGFLSKPVTMAMLAEVVQQHTALQPRT